MDKADQDVARALELEERSRELKDESNLSTRLEEAISRMRAIQTAARAK